MRSAKHRCAPQKIDPALIARFGPAMDRLPRAGQPDEATGVL